MVRNHSYARGKLREAIFSLATGPGDIRKRLIQAHNAFFIRLKNNQFPVELQSDWEWIQNELTKKEPIRRGNESVISRISRVENTCMSIKNKTGVKIAQKILKIYESLEFA